MRLQSLVWCMTLSLTSTLFQTLQAVRYPSSEDYAADTSQSEPENRVQFERIKTVDPRDYRDKDKETKALSRNQKGNKSTDIYNLKEQRRKTEDDTKDSKEIKSVGKSRYRDVSVDYEAEGQESQARYYSEWDHQGAAGPAPWPDQGWNKRYPVNVLSNSLQQEMMLMEVLQDKVRANKTAEGYRGFHNNLMEMLGKSECCTYHLLAKRQLS